VGSGFQFAISLSSFEFSVYGFHSHRLPSTILATSACAAAVRTFKATCAEFAAAGSNFFEKSD
jgi:hypothetical protein